MRHLVVLLVLLSMAGEVSAQSRIVLLRGRYKPGGPALFNFAGEMADAAHGVAAADALGLSESERVRLERVVQRYHSGGTLYVLLDEEGSTVAQRAGTAFTMVYPGGGSEIVSAGFVDIGNGAPAQPFVAPWWAWASLYRRNVGVTVRRSAAQTATAPLAAPVPIANPATAAVPAVLGAPVASAIRPVTSPARRTVYPLNYTYVAPPRPRVVAPARSNIAMPAVHGALVGWGSARSTFVAPAPVMAAPVAPAAPAASLFVVPWHAQHAHPSFSGGLAHAHGYTLRSSFRRR